jgi:hypothetical protein
VKFPYNLCTNDHLTHLFPKIVEAAKILSRPLAVMTNPFPNNQHMASNSLNGENVVSGSQNPLTQNDECLCINMAKCKVNVATQSHDYSSPLIVLGLESPPPSEIPLQIEKPDPPPRILKGVLKISTHNLNAIAENYSTLEDLGQNPYAMLALEVLRTCPSQRNSLLTTLEALDPCGSKFIKFDVMYVKPRLPYHVAFQIHMGYSKYTIKCTFFDENIATCVMSLFCWKSLSSLTLSQSPTMLNYFDSRSFHPHGILPSFLV